MKTVVLTFVYPAAISYFFDLIKSLNNQFDMDYDLLVINDGIQGVEHYFKDLCCDAFFYNHKGSLIELRKFGITKAVVSGYSNIVFADADDFFSEDRIQLSKKLLQKHEIIVNDLELFYDKTTKSKPFLSASIGDGTYLYYENVRHFNCFGLSNTAIRSNIIGAECLSIPEDLIAFDWAFFALLLRNRCSAYFTTKYKTYYRQHNNNIASPVKFNISQIVNGVKVKYSHYTYMATYDESFKELALDFKDILEKLSCDIEFLDKYCQAVINNAKKNALWWESIKTLEELG